MFHNRYFNFAFDALDYSFKKAGSLKNVTCMYFTMFNVLYQVQVLLTTKTLYFIFKGLLIFITHVLMNNKVRKLYKKKKHLRRFKNRRCKTLQISLCLTYIINIQIKKTMRAKHPSLKKKRDKDVDHVVSSTADHSTSNTHTTALVPVNNSVYVS